MNISKIAFVGSGMVAGFAAALFVFPTAQGANGSAYRQFDLFTDAFEKVRSSYVRPVDDQELINDAIDGMVSSLDPHSSYMDAKAFADMQVTMKGEFGGLGIEVTMDDGLVKVISPIDDTPAARAGIKTGDYIAAIDGVAIQGMDLNDAIDKMRGKPGTKVTLTILRTGAKKPFDVTLNRAIVKVESVRWRPEGDVGYIRITSFTERTDSGLEKARARPQGQDRPGPEGLCARHAQRSGRAARPGRRRVGRFPQRHDGSGFHPRPPSRRHAALQRPRRRHHRRQAGHRAG